MDGSNIFWDGFKIGAEKEFPELFKEYHKVGDKIDSLNDQLKELYKKQDIIKDSMPSWAQNALDGSLSLRCYAYYRANEYGISVEEAEKMLLDSFKKTIKKEDGGEA